MVKFALICPKISESTLSLESLISGLEWTSNHRFYYQKSLDGIISESDLPLDKSIIAIALEGDDEQVFDKIREIIYSEKNTDFNILFLVTLEVERKFKEDCTSVTDEKEGFEFIGEKWEILENGSYVMKNKRVSPRLEEEKIEFLENKEKFIKPLPEIPKSFFDDSQNLVKSEEISSKGNESEDNPNTADKKSESYNLLSSDHSGSQTDRVKNESYIICEIENNEAEKKQENIKEEVKSEIFSDPPQSEDKGSYPFCESENSGGLSGSGSQEVEKVDNPRMAEVPRSKKRRSKKNKNRKPEPKKEFNEKPEAIIDLPPNKGEKPERKSNLSSPSDEVEETKFVSTEPVIINPVAPENRGIDEEEKIRTFAQPVILNESVPHTINFIPKEHNVIFDPQPELPKSEPVILLSPKSSVSDPFQSEGSSHIPSKASDPIPKHSFPDNLSSISVEAQSSYSDSSKFVPHSSSEQLSQSAVPFIIPSEEIAKELIINCISNSKEKMKTSQALKREFMIQSWTIRKNLEILKKQDLVSKVEIMDFRKKEIEGNLDSIEANIRKIGDKAQELRNTVLNEFPEKISFGKIKLPRVGENWMKFSDDSVKLEEKQSVDRALHEFTIYNTRSYKLSHLKLVILNTKTEVLDFSLNDFEESFIKVHYLYDLFESSEKIGCLEAQVMCCSMKMSEKIVIPWLEIEWVDKQTIKIKNRYSKLENCYLDLDGNAVRQFDIKHFDTITFEVPESNLGWRVAKVNHGIKGVVSNVLELN